MSERILDLAGVQAKVPWSRTTIWRKVRNREFPPPISLGGRRVGWLESEVLKWISDQPRAIAYRGASVTVPLAASAKD
ncbi:MAG: AlpA family phage regulatory protein [Candidatus Binataceae bacterium]|nr:AlpA family phage regulatory protein [Candidatus Binataceae bacterium]